MKRTIEKFLLLWKNSANKKPLIIRGARQVGKTYSLKKFGAEEFPVVHYINFEENEHFLKIFEGTLNSVRILDELRFALNKPISEKTDLLIFDEIQRCPRALTSLKYFAEEMPFLAVCAAGSLLGVFLGDDSFPVGKVTFLDLFPLTFEEFLCGIGEDAASDKYLTHDMREKLPETVHERLWELWKHYVVTGGLPEAINAFRGYYPDNRFAGIQAVRTVQRDLIDTYVADIAKHSGKTNALHIERVWRSVPSQLARTAYGTTSRFKFRDVIPGIRGYDRLAGPLDWLEGAGLLIRTSIISTPTIPLAGQAVENRFKVYFSDIGLLCAIGAIKPATLLSWGFGSYQGYIAENFVAQHLRAAGQRNLYCWEGRTSEVEFILDTRKGLIPCEVKSGRNVNSKSLNVYQEKYNPDYAIVFSARNFWKKGNRKGIPLYMAGRALSEL